MPNTKPNLRNFQIFANSSWIIGVFIIKHKLRFSDEETLQTIPENPYMQFFWPGQL